MSLVLNYLEGRSREAQGWFFSAILRLSGVGLAIDFLQCRHVEMVIPFANCSWTKPGSGELVIVPFVSVVSRTPEL